MKIKKQKIENKQNIVEKSERVNKRNDFRLKKKEMNGLLKEARQSYLSNLRANKKKNINDRKQSRSDYKLKLKEINNDYSTKKISLQQKQEAIDGLNNQRNSDNDSLISMKKNRKLSAVSEYKRTLTKIQKTYMDDVIMHLFSYRFKRWLFGINKEFSRVSWWSRKHVILDFITVIAIVAILALIFMGIDALYLHFSPTK